MGGFFGWCSMGGGGVFHLHPVTPLSLREKSLEKLQNGAEEFIVFP